MTFDQQSLSFDRSPVDHVARAPFTPSFDIVRDNRVTMIIIKEAGLDKDYRKKVMRSFDCYPPLPPYGP